MGDVSVAVVGGQLVEADVQRGKSAGMERVVQMERPLYVRERRRRRTTAKWSVRCHRINQSSALRV